MLWRMGCGIEPTLLCNNSALLRLVHAAALLQLASSLCWLKRFALWSRG